MVRLIAFGLLGAVLCLTAVPGRAAVWEMTGRIGFMQVYAQLDDTQDPFTVMLRVENMSELDSIKVSRFFVQMTDSEGKRIRPISADEVASEYLQALRLHLPQHAPEIDAILGEIQADFPQEKLVEVYGRLKQYMAKGRPITWRTNLENFLLGKRHSTGDDYVAAEVLIEKIGELSKNYFWPTEIAPDSNYTGIVYFKGTFKQPVSLFFQQGDEFIGAPMQIIRGDTSEQKP